MLLSASAAQGNVYAQNLLDRIHEPYPSQMGVADLFYYLSKLIERQRRNMGYEGFIKAESKLMKKIQRKKEALGIKIDTQMNM